MCLKSNLTKGCGSAGMLKSEIVDALSFLQAPLVCIPVCLSEILCNIEQKRVKNQDPKIWPN